MKKPSTFADFAARLREFMRNCGAFHEPECAAGVSPAETELTDQAAGGTPAAGSFIAGEPIREEGGASDEVGQGTVPPSRGLGDSFEQLARALFELQFTHNAPYRRLCQARGICPETLGDWAHIPAMPAALFKTLDVTCLSPADRTSVFRSSGTAGQSPSRHFHCPESMALYESSLVPSFTRHLLIGPEERPCMLFLTPPPAAASHSSLVHMFETVRRELGGAASRFAGRLDEQGAWTLDGQAVVTALGETNAEGYPVAILGTAFNFVQLGDYMTEHNLRLTLPSGSRVMETGGYKGRSRSLPKADLHGLITERLGIPASCIVCEYGMSELSSQAYDLQIQGPEFAARAPDRVFHFPPWARAQVISPETGGEVAEGETGLIRVFDLANVWSVMAVQTEDLGVRRGDGFELIGRSRRAEPRGCSWMTA